MNRVQAGFDPVGETDGGVVEVLPRLHGLRHAMLDSMARADVVAAPRLPGKLAEYPSRVEHARAHRLRSEIRRRDRRRARTGRAPIQPATYPKRRPILPLSMWQQVADFASPSGWLTQAIERAVVPMREAMRALAAAAALPRPELERIASERLRDGTTPVWTIRDDVAAYRRRVEADQPRRYATGGFISPPRDRDDDTIPVLASPGEIRVAADAIRHYESSLLQHINAPVQPDSARAELGAIQDGLEDLIGWRPAVAHVFALAPPDPDVTHHDRWLGEGALERDETSSVHSTDSSGTGAVWSDLMARIDDLIEE